jgi:hypothetical protein
MKFETDMWIQTDNIKLEYADNGSKILSSLVALNDI